MLGTGTEGQFLPYTTNTAPSSLRVPSAQGAAQVRDRRRGVLILVMAAASDDDHTGFWKLPPA
jgi:hypothetical protein